MSPLPTRAVPTSPVTDAPSLDASSWRPRRGGAGPEEVRAAFEGLADRLDQNDLAVVQERIYAPVESAPTVAAIRRDVLRARGLDESPVTFVCNRAPGPGLCAGVHLLAVRPGVGESVRTVQAGRFAGRELAWDQGRALFVADIAASPGAVDPLAEMFQSAAAALAAQGLDLRDVARSWLYVADLVRTYPRLNSARDQLFLAAGVKGRDGWLVSPPASTGIQGVHPRGAACFADLLAVATTGGVRPFEPVRPALQPEAWEYGSSFSRGMTVDLGGRRLVTISGTASIDKVGLTLHEGDHEAQILETMRNIASLLRVAGVEGPDSGLWTLYFKDEEAWEAWQRLERRGAVQRAPSAVAVFGDVCRDDLLFEAEVTIPG